MTTDGFGIGTVPVEGCVTDRLTLTNAVPADQVPDVIERDRVLMAARPGMHQKLLPILAQPGTDTVLSGGAYLLDTVTNAEQFTSWVANDFELDGVRFPDRPMFQECSAKVWRVIAAENFRDLFTQQGLMRIEEWQFDAGAKCDDPDQAWPAIREHAAGAGLSSAWLLYDAGRREISIVITAPSKSAAGESPETGIRRLAALAAQPSIGHTLEKPGVKKIFDRTSFIYSIWFPVTAGGHDKPPLFPNSPPFPAPSRIL